MNLNTNILCLGRQGQQEKKKRNKHWDKNLVGWFHISNKKTQSSWALLLQQQQQQQQLDI
jgi:hypothetical protein